MMEYDFYPPRDIFSVPKASGQKIHNSLDKNIYHQSFIHHIFAWKFYEYVLILHCNNVRNNKFNTILLKLT